MVEAVTVLMIAEMLTLQRRCVACVKHGKEEKYTFDAYSMMLDCTLKPVVQISLKL